ncbi:hypothetical protein KEM48_000675 [Puccinia striiformis f. sp. tritici PST-130]|nr:hypothetical protein KEM48_000675 [Puccinia striiformis f. sp. tritici PST-130]
MLPQIAKYKAEIPRKSYDLRIAKHLPVERDHMDSSRKEVANFSRWSLEKYNIQSHSKPYRAPLLNFKSLYPFSDDFDPAAVWGLRRLIEKGDKSGELYIFVLFLTICDLLFVG